jgi:hypothetical protein
MSSYDATGYVKYLQKRALRVVEVASTPTDNGVLQRTSTDPAPILFLVQHLGCIASTILPHKKAFLEKGKPSL